MERYEAYKDSGVEWIGEIPEGWEACRLKQHNSIAGRIGWQGLTSDEYRDEGPFLITGVNFDNGVIDWGSCVHITNERWDEATQIQVVNGDLLITKDGTVGKVAFVSNLESRASLNSGVMVIRPITLKQNMRYLFWTLQSEVFWGWFADINSGNSTIIHLYQRDFLNFDYYLPPLDEQRAIADFLDAETARIDGLVADCEREVGLLQEYRKAVISEAVTKGLDPHAPMKDSGVEWIGEIPEGWRCLPLKHLTTSINSGTSLDGANCPAEEGEKGVLTLSAVYQGKFNPMQNKAVHESLHHRLSCPLSAGSLLISRCNTSEWVGTAAYVDTAPSNLYLPDKLWQLSFESNPICRYIQYSLQSIVARNHFALLSVGASSTMQNIAKPDLLATPIALPETDELSAIISYLDAKTAEIDGLIEAKRQMAEKLREYRKSLISEAVTGKFKVPGVA